MHLSKSGAFFLQIKNIKMTIVNNVIENILLYQIMEK